MLIGITLIILVYLVNMKELMQERNKGKVRVVYFTLMGLNIVLFVLIKSGIMPENPIVIFMEWTRSLGLGEG